MAKRASTACEVKCNHEVNSPTWASNARGSYTVLLHVASICARHSNLGTSTYALSSLICLVRLVRDSSAAIVSFLTAVIERSYLNISQRTSVCVIML